MRNFIALPLVALVAGLAALSQKPAPQPPSAKDEPAERDQIIKVDVDLVNVLCSVRDKKGAFLTNLTKDDFAIYEEGKQQEIRYFGREKDLPLTIGLLVDVSKSQESLIDIERRAGAQFFERVLTKKDMAFLISFGAEVELLQDLTNSNRTLRKGLDELKLNAGVGGVLPSPTGAQPRGTVMFDAVYLAANEKLKREVGRKVMVLITDGVDQGSRLRIHDAIEAAQKSDAIIYAVYYADPRYQFGFGASDGDLKRMATETGGRVYYVNNRRSLENIFDEIQEEMRSQYAIGYSSSRSRDGSFRKIEIKTKARDTKVQARRGYYATKE
ncbi:MAG: VWA domain-containing protein [Bryobacteraceae bacterium]